MIVTWKFPSVGITVSIALWPHLANTGSRFQPAPCLAKKCYRTSWFIKFQCQERAKSSISSTTQCLLNFNVYMKADILNISPFDPLTTQQEGWAAQCHYPIPEEGLLRLDLIWAYCGVAKTSVKALTDVLWHVDGHQNKFSDRIAAYSTTVWAICWLQQASVEQAPGKVINDSLRYV